jgi:hypothetical protein
VRTTRSRLAAFALVLAVGLLLLVSLLVSAAIAASDTLLARFISEPSGLLHAVNTALSLVVITVLFALIFKYLPDTPVRWGDVWIGAAITSVRRGGLHRGLDDLGLLRRPDLLLRRRADPGLRAPPRLLARSPGTTLAPIALTRASQEREV